MTGPCVEDTPTIELLLVGSPGSLEANVRNPANTFSGTAGDDTTHNVNDHDTPHTLSQTWNITNGGTAPLKGIVVVAVNPVFLAAPSGDITITGFARLNIDGVLSDERDMLSTGLDLPASTSNMIGWGALVGQIDLAAGDDVDVQLFMSITQTGASGPWTFRWGGSKMVATLGY